MGRCGRCVGDRSPPCIAALCQFNGLCLRLVHPKCISFAQESWQEEIRAELERTRCQVQESFQAAQAKEAEAEALRKEVSPVRLVDNNVLMIVCV